VADSIAQPGSTSVSAEDIARHVCEMQKEWDKAPASCCTRHIQQLLKATVTDRTALDAWALFFDKYPCFQDANNVSLINYFY